MEFSTRVCFKWSAAGSGMLMDKPPSSRKQKQPGHWRAHFFLTLPFIACILFQLRTVAAINLSHGDALRIAKKVWQNECNGTIAGLTSWNEGENFASLGIGHFIWYAKDQRGPFEESFPKLVSFISGRGAKLPKLLSGDAEQPCPWNSRAEFLGALHTERYHGHGWGLLQVLVGMHRTAGDAGAVDEFVRSAKAVLIRRVQNAPAERRESRWLSGWIRRVNSYSGG